MTTFRVGVDIGGTFTDILAVSDEGHVFSRKVSSTTGDYGRGVAEGVADLLEEIGGAPGTGQRLREVTHGTTVATNTILEHTGARTGLLTTQGFRDVLEIKRCQNPQLNNALYVKPEPLVPRWLRREVPERMTAAGGVLQALDEEATRAEIQTLLEEGVDSIAVCLLHAWRNPAHERRIGELITELAPHVSVSLSCDVLPEVKEYERTSTTVINAYIRPVVEHYLNDLTERLREAGVDAPLALMQSNGGILSVGAAASKPVQIVESGPAAGAVAARLLCRRDDIEQAIAFDMGGTTAKATLIEAGELDLTSEFEVGAELSAEAGGGYALKTPVIDISEIGAGGGSILSVDAAGGLQVGPRSAGAVPGPACYRLGGDRATVTDANLVLGFLNPEALAGGSVPLDAGRARRVLDEQVAGPLGVPLHEAVWTAHVVANAKMVAALKAVSSERGRDPRAMTLIAYGGNGPVHAAGLAELLEMPRVVVPPVPGLFSAYGLLAAEHERHSVATFYEPMDGLDLDALNARFQELEQTALAEMAVDGFPAEQVELRRAADLRYAGQGFELTIPIEAGGLDPGALDRLRWAFVEEHARTYGHGSAGDPLQFVALRLTARGLGRHGDLPAGPAPLSRESRYDEVRRCRVVYFGPAGWHETAVLDRPEIGREARPGPFIVEEYDATTVVPPGWSGRLDAAGNIVLERVGDGSERRANATNAANGEVDPLTFELVRHGLENLCDEMAATATHAAFSPIMREAQDLAAVLLTSEGEVVAQARTLSNSGSMQSVWRSVVARYPVEAMRPGDLYIVNDPYYGAGHLPDIFLIKPVFLDGELVAFASTEAHMADIGGRVPGGNACDSTEIYQEGLRIPPLKLIDAGEPVEPVWELLRLNVRMPDQVLGDLRAIIAAAEAGERGLLKLIGGWGRGTFQRAMGSILDYTERLTRTEIAAWPDGSVSFEDWIDDDGLDPDPIKLRVTLTVQGDRLDIDFTGTDPQVRASINHPGEEAKSLVMMNLKTAFGTAIPRNSGAFRPLTIRIPEGTVLNPVPPAAVSARGLTQARIGNVLLGALAQIVPERVMAADEGGNALITFAGTRPDGRAWLFTDMHQGAWGGRHDRDGVDAIVACAESCANIPCEVIELEYPLRITEYRLVPDTGGAGKFRGGLGFLRRYQILEDETMVQVRSDRLKFPPYGLFGGRPGSLVVNVLNPGPGQRELPSKFMIWCQAGDVYHCQLAGGGGWGDPLERDPALVLADVRDEKVSIEAAARDHGVVIDPVNLVVDEAATEAERVTRQVPRRQPGLVSDDPC
jgi:N-methylhydantoinase A/oxoprolinase/acetone carboxylase beta subunit/N-methylhydantoinase B/oxoprolinase/acetone carboxylase alpha subunit